MSIGLGLRILVVEDDNAVREPLAELLTEEGYAVATASSGEEGLEALGHATFDLILTDYALPGRTGVAMLREAGERGLLAHTTALVLTASLNAERLPGVKELHKPLDLDLLFREIDHALAGARRAALERAREGLDEVLMTPVPETPHSDLILYISASSPASLRAVRNLHRLLAGYNTRQVRLTVCDLSREAPDHADEDRVVFTPTLVRRTPEPRTWIVGDLENTDLITDLLHQAGIEKKDP